MKVANVLQFARQLTEKRITFVFLKKEFQKLGKRIQNHHAAIEEINEVFFIYTPTFQHEKLSCKGQGLVKN